MILVTGHPRSGTRYTATLLQAAGKKIGHEVMGRDGVVSWLHISKGGKVSWLSTEIEGITWPQENQVNEVEERTQWDKIIHIVRDPLKVISSCQTLSNEAFDYMFADLKDHPGGERGLKWYMWTWLKWNKSIEKLASKRFRVEDLSVDNHPKLQEFLSLTDGIRPKELPSKNVNARPHTNYSWLDLEREDSKLCAQVQSRAIKYGYDIFRFGAVMMAKNEEHNLRRCLDSICHVVDEIILVDTGSTDDTVKIAREYGAKVYHHKWEDNFSLHRNQSLSYSTCDWVIQIDCDEELCGDVVVLKKSVEAVSKSSYNAMAMLLKDMLKGEQFMRFNASRIFKKEKLHYEDIVHNRPIFDGDAAMLSGEPAFWLQHYGYDLPKQEKLAKLNRTKKLLQKRIAENIDDIPAYFYLSQVEGELGDNKEVLRLVKHYITNREKVKTKFNESSFYTHLQALYAVNKGKYNKEYVEVLNQYMNELPLDLDITFTAMEYSAAVNNTKLLKQAAEKFISNYLKYSVDSYSQASRFTYTFKPECYCMALFYSVTLSFSVGVKNLDVFNKMLSYTNPEFKRKAAKDMQLSCRNMGVNWEYADEKVNSEYNKPVTKKKRKKRKGKGN